MDGRKTRPLLIWSSSSSSSSYGDKSKDAKSKPASQLQKSSNLNSHKRE
jgi:hypothetical protein